ncbi:RHS repeat-associated core domain-containing protein [Mucilaginibacter sp. HC2]|uniref:DUF6443 domain-containing protein n=1 Tax=Mucilaginibacter inviolabilis TaxID=2714892 RepID=UPI0014086F01|nr:DUF6443 domain-containing protein [Mucilaginibacter inviolabilis]NHA06996.1 RHS repeat-associated core domain-containing protein [Mucilaginibacter inviolabilis]
MKIIKRLTIALSLWLGVINAGAQTPIQVTAPMTGTPTAGSYFSYSGITLSPNFSFTAAAGSSLSLYIANPDCQPLLNSFNQDQNYIVTSVPRVGGMKTVGSTPNSGDFANRTSCDLMQTVQYFDGLGRPLQTVQVKGSTANKDMVQPVVYDQFGREVQKYLPYAAQGTADGSYKSTAISDQGTFYNSPPSTSGVSINTAPYAITNFEPSPLNRIVEQGAPGAVWQPNGTSGHTNKVDYTTNNTTALSDVNNSYLVALYTVTINSDQSRTLNWTAGANGNYTTGQLYVTINKDENWVSGKVGTTEEYKDKEGHVVLKRTFNQVGTTVQVLSTYYIYDDRGNLAFVLPPNSGADAGITSTANQTTLDNLCYQYRYDERNRLTEKKLPGKGWEFIIYNKLDQVIFTQDANQRNQTPQIWTYTQYDAMGRVVVSGLWNSAGASGSNGDTNQSKPDHTLKNWLISWANAQTTLWLSPDGTTPTGYSNIDPRGTVLQVNYYDDYNNMPGLPAGYLVSSGVSTMTKGLLTASKTAVLNNPSDYLWMVHYYDDKGRETQLFKQHYLGGVASPYNYDQITNTYNNITSELTDSKRDHYTKNAGNTAAVKAVTIGNTYVYDHMGRKIQIKEQIGGGPNILLSQTDYNEIGQVQTKHLHGASGAAPFLQNIAYTYNERGWLTGNSAPLFAMQLIYNNGNAAPFNGNISNQTWQVQNGANKTYNYSYDALNRLTAGISNEGYSEQGIDYDLAGNIQHLTRQSAAYTYVYTGNQLQSVSGLTTGTYQYDPNGNVKFDARTQKNITYNLLNLPQSITATGFNLSYTYDAAGQKLRKNNGATTTDYISGIQYENGNIIFIQTEEGRAINSGGSYLYEYSLTDHLGNSRLSFDQNSATAIKQQDDYYPFGMEISRGTVVSPKNEYLYNKKELQEELGQYDYGARFYDAVIARWGSIDAFAERYDGISPYSYGGLNPIVNIDVHGDSLMMFKNGVYQFTVDNGKKEMTGFNQESTRDKDGKETFTGGQSFEFNDIKLDEGDLKTKKEKLKILSQSDVENFMKNSGADKQGFFSRWGYTLQESNGNNLYGSGNLDFRAGHGINHEGTMYVINGVGYNGDDAGNYLWGYAMARMGFTSSLTAIASNANAWWSAKTSNGQGSTSRNSLIRWFENRTWTGDAVADQRAILKGYNDAGGYFKYKWRSVKISFFGEK